MDFTIFVKDTDVHMRMMSYQTPTNFGNDHEEDDPDLLSAGREVRNIVAEWVHGHYPH